MKQQEDVCLVGIDVVHVDDDDPISKQLNIIDDEDDADADRIRSDWFEGIEMKIKDRSCL